jgi:SAM-dependent methyltransferase
MEAAVAETATLDSWERGNPYEQYVGRWSRQVAPRFLSWLDLPAGRRWLDVGCGTGALSAAIVAHCAPSAVTGIDPSTGFLETARSRLADAVTFLPGNAAGIPLDDQAADAVVSGLVLNFVPDPRAALAEMQRVAVEGGTIGAYVWDYAGRMQLMRYFWDAAAALDPRAAALDEGVRFPLCGPDALAELFAAAALRQVSVAPVDIPTDFTSFEDYWEPFEGGQGPAPAYAMSLAPDARSNLRERLRERVPAQPDGSIRLTARAWMVRGIVQR